jgi:hypothetical protein
MNDTILVSCNNQNTDGLLKLAEDKGEGRNSSQLTKRKLMNHSRVRRYIYVPVILGAVIKDIRRQKKFISENLEPLLKSYQAFSCFPHWDTQIKNQINQQDIFARH